MLNNENSQIVHTLNGDGPDNPRNSEGSFVTLKNENILFAYSRYNGDDWGDHSSADIAMIISEDSGTTWSDDHRILVKNEGGCNVMSVTLLRLQNGRIALFYLLKNSLLDCRLQMRTSDDEGETWSAPVCCIPSPGYFVVNNDRVIQLTSGRLVVPAAYHRAKRDGSTSADLILDHRSIIMFYYSNDNGQTWHESADWHAFPGKCPSGLQEPGVIELQDGSLYAWSRTEAGYQYETRSEDQGDTWSVPVQSQFRSPCSPMSIKRHPATGNLIAIWNDHSKLDQHEETDWKKTSWGRTPLSLAISTDDGATWSEARNIETDPNRGFCYTAIHFTSDAMLLAYCCGGDERAVLQDLCIRRISLDALEI